MSPPDKAILTTLFFFMATSFGVLCVDEKKQQGTERAGDHQRFQRRHSTSPPRRSCSKFPSDCQAFFLFTGLFRLPAGKLLRAPSAFHSFLVSSSASGASSNASQAPQFLPGAHTNSTISDASLYATARYRGTDPSLPRASIFAPRSSMVSISSSFAIR